MDDVQVREAREADVPYIREIFRAAYGADYPYVGFYDDTWLKRSVFTDDILMLVAEDGASGEILGTASVVFDVGAHSDLVGEFGRLAVRPEARERGVGRRLMEQRIAFVEHRLHVGVVENRCIHSWSQRISIDCGFAPVGFLPSRHQLATRESVALFARLFGDGPALRRNHPRVVPEIQALANAVLPTLGVPLDVIVDEDCSPYPPIQEHRCELLDARGVPSLLRIARGRLRNREIFGPMRLQYGFFKLEARKASYLIAYPQTHTAQVQPITGAVGFLRDEHDRAVRIFELIAPDDSATRFLLEQLLQRCENDWQVAYVETDVSAYAPAMQRTLVELGFVPAAYIPAGVFHEVERLDVVRMVKLLMRPQLGPLDLLPEVDYLRQLVMQGLTTRLAAPRLLEAIPQMVLFRGLNLEQQRRVACVCELECFGPGDTIFSQGAPPQRLYLLLDGLVEVLAGQPERRLGAVHAGECLGEVAVLSGEPHSATARALEPVAVGSLSQEVLHDLIRTRPDIGVVVYRNLAVGLGHKLRRIDAWLVEKD